MNKKNNSIAKWIIIAIAIGGLIFNSGILYNDVHTLKGDVQELKESIDRIEQFLLFGSKIPDNQ